MLPSYVSPNVPPVAPPEGGHHGIYLFFNILREILKPPRCAKPPLAPARPPKDPAGAFHVKQRGLIRLGASDGCVAAFPCQRAQNAYNAAIRGSRPGAERTVSAISPPVL